ncbi:MAG TPA: hypothetical protein VE463_06565 [Blastococcus sp.]|nr:hypothetical protein [Blastococcus sp.]
MRRSWLRLVPGFLLAAVLAVTVLPGAARLDATAPAPVELEEAADMAQFRAGNIISDAIFFNGYTWAAHDVQAFLQYQNPTCKTGSDGAPCLKVYTESTPDRPADAYCQGYLATPNETAASIIMKVGRSCGINQRVLLVMLQKEQGLVTGSASSLTWTDYRSAMGFGCPDTAACDTQYYGFFNQVYNAARQFRVYAANPTRYGHRPGQWTDVRFHPNAACGTSRVYIENQATAGLYNYTPYQPNAAALAAGRGTGDACSAYGNRNFWGYFTDWFGSTYSLGADRIADHHVSLGGNAGVLGAATSVALCGMVREGCGQQFERGSIYWSPATGAHATSGAIRQVWMGTGWETGVLGYPSSEITCGLTDDGCIQEFQGGTVSWSPNAGALFTNGAVRAAWVASGREAGPLGYPTTAMGCGMVRDGCGQQFEHGSVYWSPASGAHAVTGPIWDHWIANGWERGSLGYASSPMVCSADTASCRQDFTGETVFWTADADGDGGTVLTTSGAIRTQWQREGAETGRLGKPVAAMVCGAEGCRQAFRGGTVTWTASAGARVTNGAIGAAWAAAGHESGRLGYPSSTMGCGMVLQGCGQQFQGGSVYWTEATGAHPVTGPIWSYWTSNGWERGTLGYATADMVCAPDESGCRQEFQGGTVTWTAATGARFTNGAIRNAWVAAGREGGALRYPSSTMGCGMVRDGCGQQFQGGSVYWSPATGAHPVTGPIWTYWTSRGWERGTLGYAAADMVCGAGASGCRQDFQTETVTWSAATGAHTTSGGIRTLWLREGAQSGPLGVPSAPMQCGLPSSGCSQQFQGGTVIWTPATGAVATSGAIAAAWQADGAQAGPLGYPAAAIQCDQPDGGCRQQFQGGTLTWSATSGAVTRNR